MLFIACVKNKKPRKVRALRGNSLCCFSILRRKRDSNPRFRVNRTTVFKTAAFDRSAIPPQRRKSIIFFPVYKRHKEFPVGVGGSEFFSTNRESLPGLSYSIALKLFEIHINQHNF